LNLIYYLPRARGWLYTSPFVTSAALLLEAEQLTFGDQAQRLRPAQPVLAGRLRSHRAVTGHRPNSKLWPGVTAGPGAPRRWGPFDPSGGGGGQQHPAITVGGGVEQRVSRAAQDRGLPGVSHHVREGAARAEACDAAALPAIGWPPVEDGSAHESSTEVARGRCVDGEAGRRNLELGQGPLRAGPGARERGGVGRGQGSARRRR
jgi:hypothetical protein